MRNGMAWSPEKTEQLKILFANGASAGKMAAEMGITRNSAIGKCHRLGLVLKLRTIVVIREPRQRKPWRQRPSVVRMYENRKRKPILPNVPDVPVDHGVGLLELKWFQCQSLVSIVGDDIFPVYCGRAKCYLPNREALSPYCLEHYQIYHNVKHE